MRTKRTRRYIEETAQEHGLRPSEVQGVAESMFRFVGQVMTEGNRKLMDFGEIRLMGWGVFKVKEGRRKHFEELNNNRGQRSQDRS